MKRIGAILLALVLAFSLFGCGKKAEEKATEKITEKALEGSGVKDVDIDDDKVTIKGEDGTEVTYGGTEWPESDLLKTIPEFKDGKITSTIVTDGYVMVSFEEVKEEDALKYIEDSKADFTKDSFEMKSAEGINWYGGNEDGVHLTLAYDKKGSAFILTINKDSKES